jgi:hypothetical protein
MHGLRGIAKPDMSDLEKTAVAKHREIGSPTKCAGREG